MSKLIDANIAKMPLVIKDDYSIYLSPRKNKKYMAVLSNGSKVHFGDNRYEQFKDKIGAYRHLDHNNEKRKMNYYSRHGEEADLHSAKWFSHVYLW